MWNIYPRTFRRRNLLTSGLTRWCVSMAALLGVYGVSLGLDSRADPQALSSFKSLHLPWILGVEIVLATILYGAKTQRVRIDQDSVTVSGLWGSRTCQREDCLSIRGGDFWRIQLTEHRVFRLPDYVELQGTWLAGLPSQEIQEQQQVIAAFRADPPARSAPLPASSGEPSSIAGITPIPAGETAPGEGGTGARSWRTIAFVWGALGLIIGVLSAVWGLYPPTEYWLWTLACGFPAVTWALGLLSRRRLWTPWSDTFLLSPAAAGAVCCVPGSLFGAVNVKTIDNELDLWLVMATGVAICAFAAMLGDVRTRNQPALYGFYALAVGIFYGLGLLDWTNTALDRQPATAIPVTIINTKKSFHSIAEPIEALTPSYRLSVVDPSTQRKYRGIPINKSQYERIQASPPTITALIHPGFLGKRWMEVKFAAPDPDLL